MKKLLCILMMLLLAFPALAEGGYNPFAPYTLNAPEGVQLEENEGTHTFVSGMTRVVAMVIDRVPDADPAQAILRLMSQFEPNAVIEDELTFAAGHVGLAARTADKYGEDIHQHNLMILSPEGKLLILSGYDLEGDDSSVLALIDALLAALTVDGAPIVTK